MEKLLTQLDYDNRYEIPLNGKFFISERIYFLWKDSGKILNVAEDGFAFFKEGLLHNLSGPAIKSRFEVWSINGQLLPKKEWQSHSEVKEYFGRIQLKNKMQEAFENQLYEE